MDKLPLLMWSVFFHSGFLKYDPLVKAVPLQRQYTLTSTLGNYTCNTYIHIYMYDTIPNPHCL